MNNKWYYWIYEHDFLTAGFVARDEKIVLIDITHGSDSFISKVTACFPGCTLNKEPFLVLIKELTEYLSGERREFEVFYELEVNPFARKVLTETASIPYGEVRSYREVAESIGRPLAFRATGSALARNPLPILIPCHRVVKSDGMLGGFGGGIDLKKKLLNLEGIGVEKKRVKKII